MLRFALVLGDRLQGPGLETAPVLPARAGLEQRGAAAGDPRAEPLEGSCVGVARTGTGRVGPRIEKDLCSKPNNIGNNTARNTSVRSRMGLHVSHMHRSA